MLLRFGLTSAIFCALSSLVLADDFTFGDFANAVVIGDIILDDAQALPDQSISTIAAGDLTVTLEKTRLEELQSAFGGTVHHDEDAGNGVTWLCYVTEDATLWFSAYGDKTTVSQVASEADTSHAATSGCSRAPIGLATLDYGIAGLGAPLMDLTVKFGTEADDVGLYSYSSTATSPKSRDFQTSQYVIVAAPTGTITGIAVGQATSK